ncbi:MAG TPA: ABC transporter permease [Actinomycetota bacterium]|jgi:peptide/nickel transport system permease protein
MGRYITRRLLYLVLVLLIISMITFVIFYVLPPIDPATAFAGKQPTPQIVNEVKRQFGLDKPLWQQYGLFIGRFVAGDEYGWPGMGFSYYTRSPVKEEVFSRAFVSVQLAVGAAVVWLLLGIPIGIVSALKRRSVVDRAAMGFALFGVSAPVFWLGLMALFIFWEKLQLLPGTGFTPFSENPGEWFGHLIMPWVCLALLFAAIYARLVRGQLIETMSEDYIRTARAKGLRERTVVTKHGLRASLTPVVSAFGVDFGTLLGGAIITETVFNIPGLGIYVVQAVRQGDLPTVLAVTVLAAFFITFMNLIVDIAYAYLDPRVRYS